MVRGTQRLLVVVGSSDAAQVASAALGEGWRVEHEDQRPALLALMPEADAILDASLKVRLDGELLGRAPGLMFVALAATGTDHVDLDHLRARDVVFRSLHDHREALEEVTAAAEHSWALLLACMRLLPAAVDHVKAGGWDRTLFPGRVLRGKTIGIIGCGRNGRWMAQYARGFGMQVLGFDPYAALWPTTIERVAALPDLLHRSDVVAVHVTLTDETRGLLSRDQFAHLKAGAVLVNTSRGAVIDEDALLDALRSGRLAGCGLDVVRHEPPAPNDPIRAYAQDHPEVVITPHIGGYCPEVLLGLVATLADDIGAYFDASA